MKFRTFKRHFKVGLKNIWRNGWMTVASIGAVTTTLILVGSFLALMMNLNQVAKNLEEDVEIKTFIELTASQEEVDALEDQIKAMPEVSSVTFSSKEEELNNLIESMGEEGSSLELFEQDNPLNDVYVVKTEDPLETVNVANKINKLDSVFKVNYGEEVVQKLFTFNKYSRNIGLVLIIGLVFTAIFLISNTIKLTIMARRKEIGIMKLVGATNSFIRWPFFVEGLLLGVLGTVIPITVVIAGYYYLDKNVNDLITMNFVELLPFNPFAWQLSLLILAIGAFIGVWGSVMSVRKFLKV
ncbi:permease-like cell division protein FtsX [Aquibacillus sp. 3ASR75-11]|uniref:Cell division protein FtsX n=1 Tax=Terrihalobacillus insolitus TaxID=2950438 RepID=A0A9X3WNK4_9BACI|nr:permease-like cell division protein FtsX [Terrihalobacillus insolitus]MDC3412244.1 permease-like cell division protein FtsX [Terrihalobacillus insolitus]MDC3423062.1 permease-like cell division protein FtsX [Terrihalobacillus insolitus]